MLFSLLGAVKILLTGYVCMKTPRFSHCFQMPPKGRPPKRLPDAEQNELPEKRTRKLTQRAAEFVQSVRAASDSIEVTQGVTEDAPTAETLASNATTTHFPTGGPAPGTSHADQSAIGTTETLSSSTSTDSVMSQMTAMMKQMQQMQNLMIKQQEAIASLQTSHSVSEGQQKSALESDQAENGVQSVTEPAPPPSATTSAGRNKAAQPRHLVTAGMPLGQNLPLDLKEKIWNNEFVDMAALLYPDTHSTFGVQLVPVVREVLVLVN